jgi:hypothetical protein
MCMTHTVRSVLTEESMMLICEGTRLRMNWGNNVSSLSFQPDDGGEEEMRGSVQDPLCAYRW